MFYVLPNKQNVFQYYLVLQKFILSDVDFIKTIQI